MITNTYTEAYETMHCGSCDIRFYVPSNWKAQKIESKDNFYCPNGCCRVFLGETKADKLSKKLLRVESELDQARAGKREAQRSNTALKGHITRAKKRAQNGTCPYCTRTFKNVQHHIECKHPEQEAKK